MQPLPVLTCHTCAVLHNLMEIIVFSRDYTKYSVKIGPDTHMLTKLLCFEFKFIHAITTCYKERGKCFIAEVPVIHNCN